MGMSNIEMFYFLLFRGGSIPHGNYLLSRKERLFLTVFTHHISHHAEKFFKNPSFVKQNGRKFRNLKRTFVHSIDGFHTIPYDETLSEEDAAFLTSLQVERESSNITSLNETILYRWIMGFHNIGYNILEYLYAIFKFSEDIFTRNNITNAINHIEDFDIQNYYKKEWKYLLSLDLEFEWFWTDTILPIPLHKSRNPISREFFEKQARDSEK